MQTCNALNIHLSQGFDDILINEEGLGQNRQSDIKRQRIILLYLLL